MPELEVEDGDTAQQPELVYESVRTLDGLEVVAFDETGSLDRAVAQRVARPWSYFHEEAIYQDQAWTRMLEDGTVEHGYRVLRTANPSPAAVVSFLETAEASDELDVVMNVKEFPDWNIPPRPSQLLSTEDLLEVEAEREAALEARYQLFEELAAPVIEEISEHGGTVTAKGPRSGWLIARLSRSALEALAARSDVYNIDAQSDGAELLWPMGYGRTDARLGVDRFHNNGYDGGQSNPTRHAFNDITIAISDTRLEDEACVFYQGANCSGASRLQERFDCFDTDSDLNHCETIANFGDTDLDNGHGTMVASIALGDYKDDQGTGHELGDPNWVSGGHLAAWEDKATGMAPEARLIFFDIQNSGGTAAHAGFADTFDDAADRQVDIYNGSWEDEDVSPRCNLKNLSVMEQELENAFDEGVFVVMAAGNNDDNLPSCPDWTTCSLATPADTPKAFAVNAYDASDVDCNADINECLWDHCYYGLGGMTTTVNGVVRTGAVSGVGLMAPNKTTHATQNPGVYGAVTSGAFGGTSAAAPHVAGMAAVVKDEWLAHSHQWVNNPGWMNVIMLAMGDRRYEPGGPARRATGTVDIYGLGNIRLRMFASGSAAGLGNVGTAFYTTSFTPGTGQWSATPWATTLPSDAELVKCIVYQIEDMSAPKIETSDLDLTLRLYDPGSGSSCSTLGTLRKTISDGFSSYDTIKMVALESSTTTLANRCARVTIDNGYVVSPGVSARVFCHYSGQLDYESPQ